MKMSEIKRREFLKKMALAGVALPLFSQSASASSSEIKRIVLIEHPDGIIPEQWYPSGSETDFTLPAMTEPFNIVKNDCVFIRGIDMKVVAGHAAFPALWRGDDTRETIDQYFAQKWRGNAPITNMVQKTHTGYGGRDLSYDTRGRATPSISNINTLFNKVYTDESLEADMTGSVDREKRRLNAVKADLETFMQGDMLNNDSLLTHKKALDDVIFALDNLANGNTKVDMSQWKTEFENRTSSGNSFDDIAYAHEDIILNALKYDRCRVFNYSFGANVWDYNMKCDDGNSYPYHNSGHSMNAGCTATRKQTSKHVAQFIQKLKTTNDIYGNPLINSTLVVYACEIGHAANHSGADIPFIMAGAGLRGGRFLQNHGDKNWNRVLVSIANVLGDNITKYGSYGNYNGNALDGLI